MDLRGNNHSGQAPPTAGEFSPPGTLDPAGPGVVGWGDNQLDPTDTGIIKEPLPDVVGETSTYGSQDPCVLNPGLCEQKNPCGQYGNECD